MQRGPVKATRLLLVLSLFFVAMTLVGCAESLEFQNETGIVPTEATATKQKLVTVYYVTREGNYLVPVNTEVPEGDDLCRHAVEKLLVGPQDKELLSSPFPPGVLLKYVYVKDDRACVDLGGDAIGTMGPAAWQQALDSLAFTLTELPDIDIKSVEVLINGVLDNNTLLERPKYINLIPGGPEDGSAARVYFSYNDIYLVPVTVKVGCEAHGVLKATLEQLVAGPQGIPYLSAVFPEGTRLLDYQQEGGLVHLNFSQEAVLRDTKGSIRRDEQSPTIGALALTLSAFPGIDQFQILIEGKPLPDINYPIFVPRSYLDREWMKPLLDIPGAQPKEG